MYNSKRKYYTNKPKQLILQLGSLLLIVIAGPLVVALLFIKQGNL